MKYPVSKPRLLSNILAADRPLQTFELPEPARISYFILIQAYNMKPWIAEDR